MTFTPVDHVAHVVTNAPHNGGDWQNINDHYVHLVGIDMSAANLNAVLDAFLDWWTDSIAPLVRASYTLTYLSATDLTVEAGTKVERTVSVAGTRAGDDAPSIECAVVRWNGQNAGKPRRALNFHSGLADGDNASNSVNPIYQSDVAEAYSALAPTLFAAAPEFVLVAVSRFSGFTIAQRANGTRYKKPTPRVTGLINPISDATVRSVIGVQKRRR